MGLNEIGCRRAVPRLPSVERLAAGRRSRLQVAAAILFAACLSLHADAAAQQPIEARWLNAVDGNWTDGGRWSTNPIFPSNGRPNPGDLYDAVIEVVGGPYTVTLAEQVDVQSLVLDSADATLLHTGGILVSDTIDLRGGVFKFGDDSFGFQFGHEIVGATIIGNGGEFRLGRHRDGRHRLRDVTLDLDVHIPETNNSTRRPALTIEDGLTLTSGHVLRIDGRGGRLEIDGSQTISGDGAIEISGGSGSGGLLFTEGTVLTIGAGMTIRNTSSGGFIGSGAMPPGVGLINEGLISGQSSDGPMSIFDSPFVSIPVFENRGIVEAIGSGRATVDGKWTNNGVFRIRDNGRLDLKGEFTTAGIGAIDRQGGTLRIAGVLDNRGATITADQTTGPLILAQDGNIVGGTVAAADGMSWSIDFDTRMDGVTLATDLEVHESRLQIRDGLTLGDIELTLSSDERFAPARLDFDVDDPIQTLQGRGRIVMTQGDANRLVFSDRDNGSLTLGSDIVVETANGDGQIVGNELINHGTIHVRSGDQFEMDTFDLTNHGTIEVSGNMTIGRAVGLGREQGSTWRNEGTIRVRPGGWLFLNGLFRKDDLGALVDEGARAVWVGGVLENTGQTLDLEELRLSVPLTLSGGTIRGGVLTNSGDAQLGIVNASMFDGVTLDMDMEIPAFSGQLFVRNGLMLSGRTLTMPEGAALIFEGNAPQFLGGEGVIFAPNEEQTSAITRIGGDRLTIGEGITIRNGAEGFRELVIAFADNRGTIISEAPNTPVTIAGENWTNRGMLRVTDGTLQFTGDYSIDNIGALERTGGNIVLQGSVDNVGRTIVQNAATGGWRFDARVTGGRIATFDGVVSQMTGTFDGVTLAGEAMIPANTGTQALLLSNRLSLDSGILTIGDNAGLGILDAVTIDGTGVISLAGGKNTTGIHPFNGSSLTIGPGVSIRTAPSGSGSIGRGNVPLNNRGTISVEHARQTLVVDGALTNTGMLKVSRRATLEIRAADWTNQGQMRLNVGNVHIAASRFENAPEGLITGRGVVSLPNTRLVNHGTIAPGTPIGLLRISGDMNHMPDGVLQMDIAGAGTQFDRLVVEQSLDIMGSLDVNLVDGFLPVLGDAFQIVTAGSLTGTFRDAAESISVGRFTFDVTYGPQTVTLTSTTACPLPGDTTPCNNVIDVDDLNAVRNHFGDGDGSDRSGILGDTVPFDGVVDVSDLNAVRNQFGRRAGVASTVPEPTTGLMMCMALVILVSTPQRRCWSKCRRDAL